MQCQLKNDNRRPQTAAGMIDMEHVTVNHDPLSQPLPEQFCSYAVTGSNDAFQAIFVCRTCCSSGPSSTYDDDDDLTSPGSIRQPGPSVGDRDDHNSTTTAAAPAPAAAVRCVCQACANQCHAEHDVEYIGMGPCYCDCRELENSATFTATSSSSPSCCSIHKASRDEATRLGLSMGTNNNNMMSCTVVSSISNSTQQHDDTNNDNNNNKAQYLHDVFRHSLWQDDHSMELRRLQWQAQELVRHSRETFWLGADALFRRRGDENDDDYYPEDDNEGAISASSSSSSPRTLPVLCDLEQLACSIFRQHWQHYNLASHAGVDDNRYCTVGAEWWVQVKSVSEPSDDDPNNAAEGGAAEAVDLHYDKDEALAESFGLGAFPVLSTVTYLTAASGSPTVIFSQRYDDSETHEITEMMVSHPAPHKHLVFDGRLLHGAPAHWALRRRRPTATAATTTTKVCDENSMRITFLVNIWLNHKPAAVEMLGDTIRQALNQVEAPSLEVLPALWNSSCPMFEGPLAIPNVTLDAATASAVDETNRIELPFVGGKATWGRDNDDDDSDEEGDGDGDADCMVLSTYPPPPQFLLQDDLLEIKNDSLLVQFGPGLEASLQYSTTRDDYGDSDDYDDSDIQVGSDE